MNIEAPRLEARISAQERLLTMLNARIEELAQDTGDGFQQFAVSQLGLEWKTDTHLEKLEAHVEELWQDMDTGFWQLAGSQTKTAQKIDARFDEVNAHLAKVDMRLETADDHFKRIDTRIKALSQDMADSFRQADEYQMRTEQQIDARFNGMDARFEAMDTRLDKMDTRFARIEATMATRDDLVRMEVRILDSIKQLFMAAGISPSLPTTEITTDIEFLPPQTGEEM